MTTYVLEGKVVPYVRMTHNGKYHSGAAGTYLASKEALSWQYLAQRSGGPLYPSTASLRVDIIITRPDSLHHCDVDNEAKALLDAANGVIYEDDRCVDEFHVLRYPGDYRTYVDFSERSDVSHLPFDTPGIYPGSPSQLAEATSITRKELDHFFHAFSNFLLADSLRQAYLSGNDDDIHALIPAILRGLEHEQ